MRPKHLAIQLSRLAPHPCLRVELEQYATEGDLAAYWMLAVDQIDGIEGQHIVDLGSGNGILGIAALLLGARKVTFVETDEDALEVLQSNINSLDESLLAQANVINARIGRDALDLAAVDLIVMNPPWGVQTAKADRPFLELAFGSDASAVHVLHSEKAAHIEPLAKDLGWEWEHIIRTVFRLPPTYMHHSQRRGDTEVMCWRFHRPGDARLPQDES
ncbi:MAG: methyltransferase [Candidatus Poseidonia sp.]|nr:methyltransferase [Poseidonia sp.]MBL6748365.1 methyltransferase [Poseidonia sp.]MBL6887139.1 methyltransferase [Poseidonia sp.]